MIFSHCHACPLPSCPDRFYHARRLQLSANIVRSLICNSQVRAHILASGDDTRQLERTHTQAQDFAKIWPLYLESREFSLCKRVFAIGPARRRGRCQEDLTCMSQVAAHSTGSMHLCDPIDFTSCNTPVSPSSPHRSIQMLACVPDPRSDDVCI